ncbi:MAG: alpha/beta hydrolase [Vicinamibacterales bacterium]
MSVIDRGAGTPVIVVPGIQGRWEWHGPAIDTLASRCRVITFSFIDETQTAKIRDDQVRVDLYCQQILEVMAEAGLESACLCGISYGGLVAAAFAARYPERITSLVLVSALSPHWRPDGRVTTYLRYPRLLTPLFLAASLRLFAEIRTATPTFWRAVVSGTRHARTALSHMFSPTRMARRASQLAGNRLGSEVSTIAVHTLIIVGEPELDRVVPVENTVTYAGLINHSRVVTLNRTGHLGSVTKPHSFAELVVSFAQGNENLRDSRRRLG